VTPCDPATAQHKCLLQANNVLIVVQVRPLTDRRLRGLRWRVSSCYVAEPSSDPDKIKSLFSGGQCDSVKKLNHSKCLSDRLAQSVELSKGGARVQILATLVG